MLQALAIEKVSLYELERKFGLELVKNHNFFREWQDDLPDLTIAERERLERVLAISANLERRSVLENTVKMAIVSPLYEQMLEDIHDLAIMAERRSEPSISLAEMKKRLS